MINYSLKEGTLHLYTQLISQDAIFNYVNLALVLYTCHSSAFKQANRFCLPISPTYRNPHHRDKTLKNLNTQIIETKKNTIMAMSINLLFIVPFLFSTTFFTALSENSTNIDWWCNKTPHPEQCKYCMNNSGHDFAPKNRSGFRKMAIQVALDRAMSAQIRALQFREKIENNRQKAALSDCLKLNECSILQLNRTLQGIGTNRSCTDFDAQTWLSTALTNLETCRLGSLELNVSNFISPIMSNNNVSELISNSLAINGVILDEESNYTYGFPSWVTKHERKLLQASTSSIKANLVVAKDGSGNYKTVQAAINAASRRRGTGRFVIHVKRGVYYENIEVGNNNNNIMLIGDGMRFTIITSGRSVGAGDTTYSSATAGKHFDFFISPTENSS